MAFVVGIPPNYETDLKAEKMRFRKLNVAIAVALSWSLVGVESSRAEDWPQWLGALRDGIWHETGIITELPAAGPPVKWRLPIGAGYTGPSVANGRLFVMDRTANDELSEEARQAMKKDGFQPGGERVLCLDVNTGEKLWEYVYDCPYRISYPSGPRCTPTIDGEYAYTLGAMGDLVCLRVKDGGVVWQTKFLEHYTKEDKPIRPPVWGYASHPVIEGGLVIVPVGGDGSAVVAFDKMTGEEVWKNLTSSDIAYAPLMFYGHGDSRQLLFWHADGVDSLNPETGTHYWHHKFPEEQTQPGMTTSIATPQFVGDLFYVSEYFSGSLILRLKSDPPGVEEVFRSATGDPRHKSDINALMTNPIIREGLVYGVTGDGIFRCSELDTGKKVWDNEKMFGEKPADSGTLFVVENEGRFFSLDDLGRLSILSLSRDGVETLSSCQLIEATQNARGRTIVWSHPAFANRCIYARNDKEIVCFDMAKPGG